MPVCNVVVDTVRQRFDTSLTSNEITTICNVVNNAAVISTTATATAAVVNPIRRWLLLSYTEQLQTEPQA